MPEAVADEISTFEYSSQDFVVGSNSWPKDNDPFSKSLFDKCLCSAWEEVEKNAVFWYTLDEVKRKPLPGNYNIMAQLNVKRFAQRRKPEEATQVMMPFNEKKFHFNKIRNSEVLFEIKRKEEASTTDRIIINVSPIENGHVLIIPKYEDCLPQVLTEYAIRLAMEITMLTSHRGFCVGFNSLCALASVNHLHLHAMYVNHRLPIVNAKTKALRGNIFVLDNYMVNGYVLQLKDEIKLAQFSRDAYKLTSYLSDNNIAHNAVMCRKEPIEGGESEECHTYSTLFIFPKKPSPGIKETRLVNSCCFGLCGYLLLKETTGDPFNCAFLELAGFLPMRDPDEYESMSESIALQILNKFTYATEDFERLSIEFLASVDKT